MGLVGRINRSPLTHELIKRLHLRRLANAALNTFPVVRRLPGSGVRYRIPYIDSITLADEIFVQRVYDGSIPRDLRTFADVGSNVGQFIALVAHVTGNRDVRGIALDADPDMVRQTEWVVHANELTGVQPMLGLAGREPAGTRADFFIHPARVKSSRFPTDEPGQPDKGAWKRRTVAHLDLEAVWRGVLGDARCDLLKVDIEGGETDFIREDNPFLARVDRVVLECHKWIIEPRLIDARLAAVGLEKRATLHETVALAVVRYARRGLD